MNESSVGNSVEIGPPPGAPFVLVTPRIPIEVMMRGTPLSTKRERQAQTPKNRRPAPRVIKSAPQMRSIWSQRWKRDRRPRLITPNGTSPLESPLYNIHDRRTFFEQTFSIDKVIGLGSFGEVFAVRSREDAYPYAVKVSLNPLRPHSESKYREAENHMMIPPHKNLLRFCRAWEDAERLYIQTELCDQSLQHYCSDKYPIPEPELMNIFVDLLHAVHHLHSNDIIHDDIKPDNIFLTRDMICKLGDFGLVVDLKNPIHVTCAEEGDSKYLAPEVLNSPPTKASDIFSLGVTILEAATNLDLPMNGDSWHQIRNGEIPDHFFLYVSTELRCLIERMLSNNPDNRPTTFELLEHPLIKRRLKGRALYIAKIESRDLVSILLSSFLIYSMAFLSFLYDQIGRCHVAIHPSHRHCSGQLSHLPRTQHSRLPTALETSSKAYDQSITGSTLRRFDDISDDVEESDHGNPAIHRMNLEMEVDGDVRPTCSSTSSSGAESNRDSSISPRKRNDDHSLMSPSPSRRRLNGFRLQSDDEEAPSSSSTNNTITFNQRDEEEERTARYERMRAQEQLLDDNDWFNEIDERPPPKSCPPRIRRNFRNMPRMPKLDFNKLDGGEE